MISAQGNNFAGSRHAPLISLAVVTGDVTNTYFIYSQMFYSKIALAANS